jgi:hypothetical protein
MPITAKSLSSAAEMTGSCPAYVNAAITLLQAEDVSLMTRVLRGQIPLLDAAQAAKERARLITSYRNASAEARAGFGRAIGADRVFDTVVSPAI